MPDTEAPAEHVASIDRRIGETERRILRQQGLLAELARRGRDTAEGEKLLRELWKTHALLHESRRLAGDRRGDIP